MGFASLGMPELRYQCVHVQVDDHVVCARAHEGREAKVVPFDRNQQLLHISAAFRVVVHT